MIEVSEDELRAALRPCRAEPEAFQRAFERKLAQRREAQGRALELQRGAWRSAAAVLPVGMFDPGAAGASTALVPHASAKSLAGVLALPAVSLAMLALAFVGSLRALAGVHGSASATQQAADESVAQWWRDHAWHAVLVLVLLLVLAWTQPLEAVLLVLLVSMVALASMLLRLSRAGAASRASVGRFTANQLGAVILLVLICGAVGPGLSTEPGAGPWIPFVLLVGSVACSGIGSWRASWSRARKLASAVLPLLILGGIAAHLHAKVRPLDRTRLEAFVADFDRPLEDVVEWMRLGLVAEWLRASGAPPSEARSARQHVEGVRAELGPGESLLDSDRPPHALLGAARAGLLSESDWASLAVDPRLQRILLLETEAPLIESATTEWLVRALARSGPEPGRGRLAARLAAAWPEPAAPRALETMAFHEEMHALLGLPLADEPLRATARRALEVHWLGTLDPGDAAAGFKAAAFPADAPDIHLVPPTLAAVRLMRRFGVPAAVDLDAVEAFLGRAATPSLVEAFSPRRFEPLGVQSYRFVAEVALRELHELRAEQSLPRSEATFLQRLLSARLLLGTLALVALCLYAVARAARFERGRRPLPARAAGSDLV